MGITTAITTAVTTAVPAAPPGQGKDFFQGITDLFTSFDGLMKVGIPVAVGVIAFVLLAKSGMGITKMLATAAAAAFATYLTIGGGINDISNGFSSTGKKIWGMGIEQPIPEALGTAGLGLPGDGGHG